MRMGVLVPMAAAIVVMSVEKSAVVVGRLAIIRVVEFAVIAAEPLPS